MATEVRCYLCLGKGHWITTRNRIPVFIHDGSCCSDIPSLVKRSYRECYTTFSRPTKCPKCGRACFFYQNAKGSKVFFDSFGPPWPKHECGKEPSAELSWQTEGFEPIHVLDASPDSDRQMLSLKFKVLRSGKGYTLELINRRDISRLRPLLGNPFQIKIDGEDSILSTFEEVGENAIPRAFRCIVDAQEIMDIF